MRVLRAVVRRLCRSWHVPIRLTSRSAIQRVLLVIYACFILLNSLFGYYPIRYSPRRQKLVFSKLMGIYCLLVASMFGAFYVRLIWQEFRGAGIDQRNAIQIYCYMNAFGALLYYFYQWSTSLDLVRFLNQMPLSKVIHDFEISVFSMVSIRAFSVVLIRVVGFPLLMELTLLLYQRHKQPEQSWTIMSRTMLPIISGGQLSNFYFCSIVLAREIYARTNTLLLQMLHEVNRLQTPSEMLLHKPYYRMQRFCDLADRLDELGTKYVFLNAYCLGHLNLGCFSAVISLGINLFNTTLGCYVQYQALVDYIMLEKPYDVAQALAHFVFLVLPFLEIVLLAQKTEQLLVEARKAGDLLQQMNLEHADIRFKQEVDAFWLKVRLTQFKLMPLGLLELDGSMVNKIYTTVAGFLLFLIQNDLTVRFSLK